MIKHLKTIFVAALCVNGAVSVAQSVPAAPFSAICVADKATGFDWENGEWKHQRFKPDDRILVQLIDPTKYAGRSDPLEIPMLCMDVSNKIVANTVDPDLKHRHACYMVRPFGREAMVMIDADTCFETYRNNVLTKVECKRMTFAPNGRFIRLPHHTAMDISSSPPKGVKDSLSLAVGSCSKLE